MFLRQFKHYIFHLPSPKTAVGRKRNTLYFFGQKRAFGKTLQASSESWVAEETKHTKSVTSHGRKPLTNTPFIKNLFLGKFDTRMLIFPEVLENDKLKELDKIIQPIEKYFKEELDSRKMDETGFIPDEVIQQLKNFGLFGQHIPIEYGGSGQTATEFARLAEIFGRDESVGLTILASQTLGLEGILAGSDEQKAKYLPKLASGEHTAAFCMTEANSGSDAATIQLHAKLSDDGKMYILNGEKLWVTNGEKADIYTVFAKTGFASHTGETVERLTAFIVEKKFGGITCRKSDEKLGMKAANTCSLHFENTPVPVENVLGSVGEGFKVAVNILNNSRYVVGSLCTSIMKKVLESTVDHAIRRKQFGRSLKDFGLIQELICRTAMNIYATESMTYMTAALMDSYVHPDASVEAAIVKVFGSEALCHAVGDCMQVMGASGITKEQDYERHLRNSRVYLMFPGTNEILRLYIALMGFQHAGADLQDTVRKMRDPLNNVAFVLRKRLERVKTNRSNPSLERKLYNHVHPDLSRSGEALELKVIKFQYMAEKYMTTFGDKLFEEQFALRRFADIAIDLYACTSCLARATRSKCIGLKHHDHEITMARTFTADALVRIDHLLEELDQGKFTNGDETRVKIAERVVKSRGYAAEHPLTRNW